MYLRFVQAKYKSYSLSNIHQIYDEKIIPRLQKVPGCLFAALVQNEKQPDEGISITLWDTHEHAEAYEKSGVFKELLDYIMPFLSDSSEWKVQLSKDLNLEYQPVPDEPVIKSFRTLSDKDEKTFSRKAIPYLFLRFLSIKIKPGMMNTFREIYQKEIDPKLKNIKGCRYAYISENLEEENQVLSLTMWDSKEDADNYEKEGQFKQLLDKVKHTFTELYQWKLALEKEKKQTVTSDDPSVAYYQIVTGKSFQ
ncbi:antibiotic biosynthesis monooxygenase [candidate division KSB1 bacterium]|nr:antibiotic biosynthesis monooxygenase [candidate division KSB1 bacterium]